MFGLFSETSGKKCQPAMKMFDDVLYRQRFHHKLKLANIRFLH